MATNSMCCSTSLSWLLPTALFLIISTILSQHVLINAAAAPTAAATEERKAYIVYMGARPEAEINLESTHLNILDQVLEGSSAKESLLYSYKRSFNGLAAMLTDQERKKLSGMKGVVSVFPSRSLKTQTSKSWDFLNFPTTVKRLPDVESDVIIGVLDTGIWPDHESFNDAGLGPPPKKWKGTCHHKIKCNNKIIGAKIYRANNSLTPNDEDYSSPIDSHGHGTHIASIAAGREVNNISLNGIANGTIRGAVPSARIAVYKVCWPESNLGNCYDHNILAGFDDAIADGVDIITNAISSAITTKYDQDAIAIGAFHAMKKGILTSTASGEFGSSMLSVANVAPWLLTVAAINTNRRIISNLTLGNNMTFSGAGLNTFPTHKDFVPILYGNDTCNNLKKEIVKGKIIACDMFNIRDLIARGAVGILHFFVNEPDYADPFPLPATFPSSFDAEKVKSYLNSTSKPVAIIHKSEDVYDSKPHVSIFSGRGYNPITSNILKPDVSAPGANILAAWSPLGKFSTIPGETRSVMYNIASGSSLACAHGAGAAAYVKSFHPEWSPAAIASALMTTAYPLTGNNEYTFEKKGDNEYGYGSGVIDPVKAVDPGLVYDTNEDDYIQMLCVAYSPTKINIITGRRNVTCHGEMTTEAHMNYPTMSSYIPVLRPFERYFPRTVTNVGQANSTYKVSITPQPLLNIMVTPEVLHFKSLNEKQNFIVSISGGVSVRKKVISARVSWSDGVHVVTSPIVVYVM